MKIWICPVQEIGDLYCHLVNRLVWNHNKVTCVFLSCGCPFDEEDSRTQMHKDSLFFFYSQRLHRLSSLRTLRIQSCQAFQSYMYTFIFVFLINRSILFYVLQICNHTLLWAWCRAQIL